MSQSRALQILAQFAKDARTKSKWAQIRKAPFALGLEERVMNPDRIAQKGTPLCAPAAFTRVIARNSPVVYVSTSIDLFTKGHGKIGNLVITPGSELLSDPPEGNTQPADWVMLASLRDSDNWVFSPSGIFGTSLAGITRPATLASWFRAAGYSQVIDKADIQKSGVPSYYAALLAEANRLYAKKYKVIMLIDADVLSPKTQDDAVSLFPDHWVALYSKIVDRGLIAYESPISMTVWTWGGSSRIKVRPGTPKSRIPYGRFTIPVNAAKPLKKKHFLNKFYGFVAAKA